MHFIFHSFEFGIEFRLEVSSSFERERERECVCVCDCARARVTDRKKAEPTIYWVID